MPTNQLSGDQLSGTRIGFLWVWEVGLELLWEWEVG